MEDSPKMGAPPIPIDWESFESLCQMHATREEFAFFFKCDEDTINNACKTKFGKTFSAVFKEMSVGGRMSLRRQMWQSAMGAPAEYTKDGKVLREPVKPNTTMQIFISKQPVERGGLGFADNVNQNHGLGNAGYEQLIGVCSRLEKEKTQEAK